MPTKRKWQWAAFWGAVALAFGLSCASYRRFPFPEQHPVTIPFPADSFARFAECVNWTRAETARARSTAIYSAPAPSVWAFYAGVQKDGWLWVKAGMDSSDFYAVLYHEWHHAAERPVNPRHQGVFWDKAASCGASLTWLDRLPLFRN